MVTLKGTKEVLILDEINHTRKVEANMVRHSQLSNIGKDRSFIILYFCMFEKLLKSL